MSEELRLTKTELAKMMKDYSFVEFVKDLDHRADEFKRIEKRKETLNGKVLPRSSPS